MIDREAILALGAPPEMVDVLMEAQEAAKRGDMGPMQQAIEILEELAEASDDLDPQSATECYPLSSATAAEALFAFSSDNRMDPGYAVAAEKALELDPNSIDALATLGDLARSADDRLSWYRRACSAANSKPRDVVVDHMPGIRFRMGCRLVEEAQVVDAIEIMLPGLDENPGDPNGMRFALIDLMLRLRWHDELQSLLDRYADDEVGPVAFARAIAHFQSHGTSRHADALLRAAHDAKPHVAPLLASIEPMPAQTVQHYRVASREEAIMIAGYLLPGIRAKDGTTRWIRETLELGVTGNSQMTEGRDGVSDESMAGAGDLDIALSLPDGTGTWLYHLHRSSEGFYLAVLLEESDIVGMTRFLKRPNTQQLRRFLLDSVCDPCSGSPRKPKLLQLPTKADVTALRKSVGTYGVTCQQHRVSAAEKAVLKEMCATLSKHLNARPESEPVAPIEVSDLPQTDEQWLMGVFQPPIWVDDRSTPYRPFMELIVDGASGKILASETSTDRPSMQRLFQVLANTMREPMFGQPRRPECVIVDPDTPADQWDWEDSSIEVFLGDDDVRSHFDDLIVDLLRGVSPVDEAVSIQPGVTRDFMTRFYQSAARFYKAAPWTMVGCDKLIKLVQTSDSSTTWGVSVIGQLGQANGLSLMEDVSAARTFIEDCGDIEKMTAVSVQFCEIFELPPLDLWYLERNGWPVASEEAYPVVMKVQRGVQPTCPSHEELQMIASLMNVMPRFLDQPHEQALSFKDDLGREFTISWEIS